MRAKISNKAIVAKLARASKAGAITVPTAAQALDTSRREAALKLARLAKAGWLRRAKRGLYLVLPLEVEPGRLVVAEDPWILAREMFLPCYIGGWSAAEHWGLTEQLFRTTIVITAANVRATSQTLLGHQFRLFRVPRSRIVDTTVWRGSERVPVSSKERTIVDCLRNPELAGGIRHLADMMREYGLQKDADLGRLTETAKEIAHGAAWKRLGYLAERLWPTEEALIAEAHTHITKGYTKLDPAVENEGKPRGRWRLRVNVTVPSGNEG
ncbi:MAG TPA: type IV toxin-antitoxin system AbiEi family antitoxin [Acidobacteriota bacterium]